MIENYFYEKTGMYIDFEQLIHLPCVDTLIDIGVGDIGTPDLYERFPNQKLILIDPLEEARDYAKNNLSCREYEFFVTAVGSEKTSVMLNVEKQVGRSTILQTTEINDEGQFMEKREINVNTLDNILFNRRDLGRIGIKIDTEGYELDVIRGANNTLKSAKFVIAEVRHNHESFLGCYKLHEFMESMRLQNFQLTRILTAKPLIADLVFQSLEDLEFLV